MLTDSTLTQDTDWQWFADNNFPSGNTESAWNRLFPHLFGIGDKATPTSKWQKETERMILEIGEDVFATTFQQLTDYFLANESWFEGKKAHLLKGLLWTTATLNNEAIFPSMRLLIEKAYSKVAGFGTFAVAVGNAGINALANQPNPNALRLLWQMKSRTKYTPFQKALTKALAKLAKATQFSEADIEDSIIPDFGIVDNVLEHKIGAYTAQVLVESYSKITVEWLNMQGKTQKSEPTILKKEHPKDLATFKILLQDLKATLQTQRHQLEDTWRVNRVWTFAHWHKYLLQNPALHTLTHRLVWKFRQGEKLQTGIAYKGVIVNIKGEPLINLEDCQVQLWHPVKASVQEVLAWREWMFQHETVQPFKQAFREIYLLTDAEHKTDTHSNRFSAHIVKQNTLWALCKQRNWKFNAYMGYDSPTLTLPEYKVRVSLEVAFAGYDYLSTQRVVFEDLLTDEVMHLDKVSAVAFSEVMRDVDLFIAVSSIGSDPNWTGSDNYQDYWQDYAFGEKSDTASARTRKEILQKIIPRLRIGKLCSFEGNFLVVQGKLKTYKINLGSSNILMSPNDQYLCIVPDRKAQTTSASNVFLPFEGDSILSLILSKAFLLVDDDQITDKTILSQLGH